MIHINFRLILITVSLTLVGFCKAQDQNANFEVPTTNSLATVQQRVAATDIEVVYNRPSVKGRKIFGALVPYDQVWRTGSDASTKISFSTPVSVNGEKIDAGTYELFTIPGKKEWTIILQQNQSQWGSYSYKPEMDVIRTSLPSKRLQETVETFNINFDAVTSSTAILTLSWEKTIVPIQIFVDLRETVLPQLEASLQKEGRKPYFRAAMFYYENDLDIDRAVELMDLAIVENPKHLGMLYRQALILKRKGNIDRAIQASEMSLELAKKAPKELQGEYIKLNTELLAELRK